MPANITVGLYTGLETFTTEQAQVSRGCHGYQIRHDVSSTGQSRFVRLEIGFNWSSTTTEL
jgi:hypothetical protein